MSKLAHCNFIRRKIERDKVGAGKITQGLQALYCTVDGSSVPNTHISGMTGAAVLGDLVFSGLRGYCTLTHMQSNVVKLSCWTIFASSAHK